jgi:hypothetical protein
MINGREGMQAAIDEDLLTLSRMTSSQRINEPDMSVHRIARKGVVCDLMINRPCT